MKFRIAVKNAKANYSMVVEAPNAHEALRAQVMAGRDVLNVRRVVSNQPKRGVRR